MLHFQISRSSVEIVGSASSVLISLAALHRCWEHGAAHRQTPVRRHRVWGVVSGQWSPDAVTTPGHWRMLGGRARLGRECGASEADTVRRRRMERR